MGRIGGCPFILRIISSGPTGPPSATAAIPSGYGHQDQASGRMECRLRTLPWAWERTRGGTLARANIANPRAHELCECQRHLHPVPFRRASHCKSRSKENIYDWPRGLPSRTKAARFFGSWKITSWGELSFYPFFRKALRTKTACREMTMCRA